MKRTGRYVLSALLAGAALPLGVAGSPPAQAASRTYYVSTAGSDSNPGTSPSKPFRTLQKAADSTAPGDAVSIMNGTYTERAGGSDVLAISRSGRPGAPITFQAHPGHHPVINPLTGWNGIRVSGASYIVIRGLEIKGDSENISLAQAEQGASTRKPKYNTNCLSVDRGATSHHIDIIGNTVHHCPGGGISAIDADHVTIDHNHVYGNAWFSVFGQSGISILTAKDSDAGDGRTYKIRITANTVHDNETRVKWEHCQCYSDGNGIIIDTLKGHDYKGRVLVANNVSYDNGGSGIHSYKSQHVDIVHNTAYQNGRSTRMDPYANIYAQDSTDVRVLNNVTSGRPGQPTNSQHRDVDVTYDYNVYYGGRAPEVKGPHDIVADPRFVKPGTGAGADFRLGKGSPAIGTAEPFPAVTTDITGAGRAGGAPDRGAYAFIRNGTAPSAAPTMVGTDNGSPQNPLATPAPGQGARPSAGTSASPGNDVRATGDGESLARTGANAVVPLGMA
ncbi:DUF1565 domain-containing protein, partial [Kitasatospora sp. NPDC007106]|uniref:right-handed parallel beta-helix repeat-containing protein n=1 Tax=Kitasatospora sp. NPDC007106 TaxID=3156914 RepID=UPI0033DACBC7